MIDNRPGDPTTCVDCGTPIPYGMQYRIGHDMWHTMRWTCGHESTLICPECYRDKTKVHRCSVCGNGCSFT